MLKLLKGVQRGFVGGVVTRLSQRSVFLLEGSSTYEFLNGMVTNKITKNSETFATYAGFLNPKGRLIADTMLYHRPESKSYFVEVSNDSIQPVKDHILKYKLRQTVFIDQEVGTVYGVWAILASNTEWRDRILRNLLNRGDLGLSMGLYIDPRWELCIRLVMPLGAKPELEELDLFWAQEGTQQEYDYLRMLNGIPEGQQEMPTLKQIPLEANMHDLNGIHFSKGCYLGQELVARTHFRGEVRKRILPLRKVHPWAENTSVLYSNPGTLIPDGFLDGLADVEDKGDLLKGVDIKWEGKSQGTVLNGAWNVVLGNVRLDSLEQKNLFSIGAGGIGGDGVNPDWQVIYPPWMKYDKNRKPIW